MLLRGTSNLNVDRRGPAWLVLFAQPPLHHYLTLAKNKLSMLAHLHCNEDAHSTIPSSDDDLHDGVECSPCPPPMAKSSLVGGLKVRRDSLSNRNALQRAQTLSQIR